MKLSDTQNQALYMLEVRLHREPEWQRESEIASYRTCESLHKKNLLVCKSEGGYRFWKLTPKAINLLGNLPD